MTLRNALCNDKDEAVKKLTCFNGMITTECGMISYGTALQSFSVFLYRELIFAISDFENHTAILTKINCASLREWVGFSMCRILFSYGEEYYDYGFLECDAVYYGT